MKKGDDGGEGEGERERGDSVEERLRELQREGTIRSHGSHDHNLSHPGRVPHILRVLGWCTHSVPSGSITLTIHVWNRPQWVSDQHSLHNHWNLPAHGLLHSVLYGNGLSHTATQSRGCHLHEPSRHSMTLGRRHSKPS